MDYKINHKYFSFEPHLTRQLRNLSHSKYIIKLVDLKELNSRLVNKIRNGKVQHKISNITQTPHLAYIEGDKTKYLRYLSEFGKSVGHGIEHSEENFKKLIKNFNNYLSDTNASNYIIAEELTSLFRKKLVILDGVHRAAILYSRRYKKIPVAIVKKKIGKHEQLKTYLNDYINTFQEWYTPIKLGKFAINERTYPNFEERSEYLENRERGKSKWNYIIKKNLPSLRNKRIYDIGCNNGLFSILLKNSGAKSVVGIDRTEEIIQPTNKLLTRQNVVQQAYFVKNLFKLYGKYNTDGIEFIAKDINNIDFSKIKCDFMYATCILYHFGEKRFNEIIKQVSKNVPEVFLQSNLGHTSGELGKLTSVKYHIKLLEKYGYEVTVDAPENYNYPVIYGKKLIK